ncbi:GntR family transcriptional regulator [Dactylosporangium sp. NPDC005555]|uniref:GntR family transcriptional regulator n=1 Tax=Dactylosporangium sp. NPDC005555 TaxID=3154889 RepID=UPI0033AD401F
MIDFQLDDRSGVATYLQLAQQVRHALRLGLLEPGDKLPTAKEVVAKLAINPNTVLKAYRELEREGLLVVRQGLGTFVRASLGPKGQAEQAEQDELRQRLADWVRAARRAGLGEDDIEAMYRAAMRQEIPAIHTEGLHDTRA